MAVKGFLTVLNFKYKPLNIKGTNSNTHCITSPYFTHTYTHAHMIIESSLLDLAIPESGTVIAEFANSSLELEFFCHILSSDGSFQLLTNWFFLSAEAKAEGRGPGSIQFSDTRFTFSGNLIDTGLFNISSGTNLTVNGLTTDLHNSTLSCGSSTNNSIAVFTIFVYGKHPSQLFAYIHIVSFLFLCNIQ